MSMNESHKKGWVGLERETRGRRNSESNKNCKDFGWKQEMEGKRYHTPISYEINACTNKEEKTSFTRSYKKHHINTFTKKSKVHWAITCFGLFLDFLRLVMTPPMPVAATQVGVGRSPATKTSNRFEFGSGGLAILGAYVSDLNMSRRANCCLCSGRRWPLVDLGCLSVWRHQRASFAFGFSRRAEEPLPAVLPFVPQHIIAPPIKQLQSSTQ